MPVDLLAAIVLPTSSVILGFLFPLAAGTTILGIIRGLLGDAWRTLLLGLVAGIGLVAVGVLLRTWGGQLGTPEQLAGANQTAAVVFTAVTPWGAIASVVIVVVGIVRLVVDRRRDPRDARDA